MTKANIPDRTELAPGLSVSRVVTGLWQVADMERGGKALDLDRAAAALGDYAAAGFDTFDMADHYGSAEDIAGRFNQGVAAGKFKPAAVFTKWCPPPGEMTPEVVRAGIQRSMDRLKTDRIDLLQLHWWVFEHPAYLDAMRELSRMQAEGKIGHLGLTNFDTDHLHLLVKQGHRIATNQVCFSLLDRRAGEEMTAFCLANGVKLLAYGTLAGGLLTEKWLDKPEPVSGDISDWSKMKYQRFVAQQRDLRRATTEALDAMRAGGQDQHSPDARRPQAHDICCQRFAFTAGYAGDDVARHLGAGRTGRRREALARLTIAIREHGVGHRASPERKASVSRTQYVAPRVSTSSLKS